MQIYSKMEACISDLKFHFQNSDLPITPLHINENTTKV